VLIRNTCSLSKIDQRYTLLIEAALETYQALFGADLLDVRLLGSVARLVTPDTDQLIPAYRTAIEALDASDRELIARYARVVGKDLLRGLRQAAILRGGAYEKNIRAIYEQVIALVPEQRALADALYALYREPHADKDVVLRVLNEASDRRSPAP
jgi:hypothetical protein